jgi:hypothetical protein
MNNVATEAEYNQTIAEINCLLRKGEAKLSPEEDRLLDLLSTLAEDWEEVHHPIPDAPGYRILKHYMQVQIYEETVYNDEYYIERERELIRQSNLDLELEELEERQIREMSEEVLPRPVLIKPGEGEFEAEKESPLNQPAGEIPF